MKQVYSRRFKTRIGLLRLSATRKGLYSLGFAREAAPPGLDLNPRAPADTGALLRRASREICRYLRGEKIDFRSLPIDWSGYGNFEKKVLQELCRIPPGETRTYQFLAERSGREKAMRYVGRILHLNRLPLVIPCHRIVPKKGGWGGFSKGVDLKKHLLKLERLTEEEAVL